MPAAVVVGLAYAAGSVPVANLTAKATGGPDLRSVGSGTVSGTALYGVSGFGALAVAGCAELAKGALGPLLAGRDRPLLGALATSAAVCGHDWSPWLGGKGGRGVSLLLGALCVLAPEGVVLLGAGLATGRALRQTGAATFATLVALPVLLARRDGGAGVLIASALSLPVLAKRVVGNDNALPGSAAVALARLVFDADRPARPIGWLRARDGRLTGERHRSGRWRRLAPRRERPARRRRRRDAPRRRARCGERHRGSLAG